MEMRIDSTVMLCTIFLDGVSPGTLNNHEGRPESLKGTSKSKRYHPQNAEVCDVECKEVRRHNHWAVVDK